MTKFHLWITLYTNIATLPVSQLEQGGTLKITGGPMPVLVFEVLEILLCKILIFAHFQVPIEGTSTSATEEFSMAKWPLASLLMILPSKKIFFGPSFLRYRPYSEVQKLKYANMVSHDLSLLETWKWYQKMPVTWYTFKWHPTCHTSCQDYPIIQASKGILGW